MLAISLLVFLATVVGWPLAAGWRRYRGQAGAFEGTEPPLRYARWVAGATSGAFLVFAVAFAAILATDPTGLLLGDPLRFRLLLVVPLLGAIGTVPDGRAGRTRVVRAPVGTAGPASLHGRRDRRRRHLLGARLLEPAVVPDVTDEPIRRSHSSEIVRGNAE
ncbi:hypothetical protein [Natrinema hispanicum]|uniref:hypothetical protein n=1 Tax=Natrinema hispanicum TaxID=392421 RepID=UPI001A92ADF3|nr:hypothetical protein [Natrinema hispanicum]